MYVCVFVCRVSNLEDLKLNTESAHLTSTEDQSTNEYNQNMNVPRNFDRKNYPRRYSNSSLNTGVSIFTKNTVLVCLEGIKDDISFYWLNSEKFWST